MARIALQSLVFGCSSSLVPIDHGNQVFIRALSTCPPRLEVQVHFSARAQDVRREAARGAMLAMTSDYAEADVPQDVVRIKRLVHGEVMQVPLQEVLLPCI